MTMIRKFGRSLLEYATGRQAVRFGHGSVALISRTHGQDAWFLRSQQTARLLRELAINLVVDVGANTGQFGKWIRQFYDGDIMSFEPVSSAYELLKSASAAHSRWSVFQLALGSAPAEMQINVAESTNFSSLLSANEFCKVRFGSQSVSARTENVAVRRLDGVLREEVTDVATRRIFLKMDTQGFDQEVFKGLGELVSAVEVMQSEVSLIPIYDGMPHWTDSIRTYERAGFSVSGLFPVNVDANSVIEYDCLLVRSSRSPDNS